MARSVHIHVHDSNPLHDEHGRFAMLAKLSEEKEKAHEEKRKLCAKQGLPRAALHFDASRLRERVRMHAEGAMQAAKEGSIGKFRFSSGAAERAHAEAEAFDAKHKL